MNKKHLSLFAFLLFATIGFAQPYVELVNFTYQHFSSNYKNNPEIKNQTDNYLFNLMYPKEFKNGNVFLLRLNAELLQTSTDLEGTACSDVSSIALPIGFQWASKSKKWKTLVMGIPKLASNFERSLTAKDWQYGGLFMENYIPNDNFRLKFGLYYNREAFGNFFVPLLGVDWKATDRIYLYGILPSNYKFEYTAIKNKMYAGLDFKWLTRSFNMSGTNPNQYLRFEEIFLKGFVDYFIFKNILLTAEAGYSFGKSPLLYNSGTDDLNETIGSYSPVKSGPVFNFGISYRIRTDVSK